MDIVVHKLNVKLFDNQSATASASVTSDAFSVQSFSLFCIQHYWSGVAFSGAAPTLEILGSNSLEAPFISLGLSKNLTSGSGGELINIEKAGYAYIKIKYTKNTATAGSFSTIINAKVL